MKTLIHQIKGLVKAEEKPEEKRSGVDMQDLNVIEDAFLLMEGDKILDFGKTENANVEAADVVINAKGKFVFPSWCDSHTHIVYAGSRELEYVDRIRGLSYEDIAKRGGGILNSSKKLNETSEQSLLEQALQRCEEIMRLGTGAVEIKSGYGLNTEAELKMLRVIREIKKMSPMTVKSTFLGAHSIPADFRENRRGYIEQIKKEMLPAIKQEKLADYIDVFCDQGFFTPEETEEILVAGADIGLQAKIHANELAFSGGVQVGVKQNALSVDHLECVGDDEIKALKNSDTMATLLPGTAFFLDIDYAPARKMIDAGLAVALASDYNPGSSPSGNMPFVLSLACAKMKMLPAEAINAATINGAYAMGLSDQLGSITKGKKANLFITREMPSVEFLPYAYGSNLIESVILNGRVQ
ncbi:MAG: imidazolonepropionase [Chitinophagales bacterium]